ncbi:PhzF family phenazine biosynthesis protein [Marinobacterium arenosum]|uniref:PhzF family phenazine biosynthesis protein n=1 Tax=Marinobacterium arenosum TaxID=2862496 RepID=UPI001C95282D|nr:PhzF family phenazine biosynthesis protein [Marinobacterium arenosum]MBY4675484.1 PhzF family phenazine biosynthesis protein [Marinobacterium arenosum]
MRNKIEYRLLDVFTELPFGGNQLAVFPQAEGLSTELMQRLANELNLAETTFVSAGEGEREPRVRIFTPAFEMPFAGHPTIGTAICLAMLDGDNGRSEWTLQENVGPVSVRVDLDGAQPRATLAVAQLPEVSESSLSRADAAALLGVAEAEVIAEPLISSCGYPFQVIQLASAEAVARTTVQSAAWQRLLADHPVPDLYVVSVDGDRAKVRMFCIEIGIQEDPATGSAAAALAGVLAQPLTDGDYRYLLSQGEELGRPSQLQLDFSKRQGAVSAVEVSGSARLVGEGAFYLDQLCLQRG